MKNENEIDSGIPRTVIRLDVDSFKRLRAAHVTPTPEGLVLVRGKNAQGKSALLEAMLAALGGSKARAELPITEGAHGAEVVVDLGDIVVKRRWTRDSAGKAKTALTVEDAQGNPQRGPQGVLDSLRGRFADPVAFLEASPADQVKTVLGTLGLAEELDRLEGVAQGYYDKRRELGRDLDRTSKAVEELSREVGDLPPEMGDEDLSALTAELQAAKDHNASIEALRVSMSTAEARGKEIVERQKKLAEEMAKLEIEAAAQREAWSQASRLLNEHPGPTDVARIVSKLSAHESAIEAKARRDVLAKSEAERDVAQAAHSATDSDLRATREEIADLLGGAQFPIPGMAYDPDEKLITINEIPFSQASQAERIKAAAAVAMAGNPSIRVLFAREGSLLDEDSRKQLADLAEERGFQLWLEVVDSTREGAGIWIEDGEAFEVEQ